MSAPRYAELCVTSNFTFLTGASHPEELVSRAAELGLEAVAITDRNSLAGVVRAYAALKTLREERMEALRVRSSVQIDASSRQPTGTPQNLPASPVAHLPRLIVGARLVLEESAVEWLALPCNRAGYERLSRLLTTGKRRATKGACILRLKDVEDGCQDIVFIALPVAGLPAARRDVRHLSRCYPQHVFLGVAPTYDGTDQAWFDACARFALREAVPMVAVGDVLMHHGQRRQLADVLTCMRLGVSIDQIGTFFIAIPPPCGAL